MKKYLLLLGCLVGFVACGGDEEEPGDNNAGASGTGGSTSGAGGKGGTGGKGGAGGTAATAGGSGTAGTGATGGGKGGDTSEAGSSGDAGAESGGAGTAGAGASGGADDGGSSQGGASGGADDGGSGQGQGGAPNPDDLDGDGVLNDDETSGTNGFFTDPNDPDTDGDGVNDGQDAAPIHAACATRIMYYDDFSYDPSGRWTVVSGDWTWDETEGTYKSDDTGGAISWAGDRPDLTDYVVETRVRLDSQTGSMNAGLIFRLTAASEVLNGGAHYYAGFSAPPTPESLELGFMNGSWNPLASTALNFNAGVFYTLRVRLLGTSIKVEVDDALLIDATDDEYSGGGVGLRTHLSPASYDYIIVCE